MSGRGAALLGTIGRLAARRPRAVVAAWLVVVGLLAFVGRDLQNGLTVHAIFVDGSASKRAHEIAVQEFGTDYGMIVLLQGPQGDVERQGKALARHLSGMPHTLVMSPWVSGSAKVADLSPRPGVSALLVRTLGGSEDDLTGLVAPLEERVDATVHGPVRVSLAGAPVVVKATTDAGAKTLAAGELVAIPVLLFVLLFVFRSVLAAIVPLVAGGCVVGATRGVVALLDGPVQFEFLVVGLIGMMGLALGVDYSLLVVSRFREEHQKADAGAAVEATVRAAARSILPAGCALLLAMPLGVLLLSSSMVQSAAVALAIATTLSMLSAVCVVPAVMMLLRNHLDRWRLPSRGAAGGTRLRWSRRIAARPGFVLAILFVLFVLGALAFNLDSRAGSIDMLPADNPGRVQQEDVERALGPGWGAPMEAVVYGHGTPITSPQRLNAIAAFQHRVEADPGIASMVGLDRIARASRRIGGVEGQLAEQEKGMVRLRSGLSRIGEGTSKTSDALAQAAIGGGRLGSGISATSAGAGALASGLARAGAGSSRLSQGLGQASEGSGKLSSGARRVSSGAGRLAESLAKAAEETGELQGTGRLFENAMHSGEARLGEVRAPLQGGEEQLHAALQALRQMSVGKSDPEYGAALTAVEEASRRLSGNDPSSGEQVDPSYAGVGAGIERAAGEFGVGLYLAKQFSSNGKRASAGLDKLARSSQRLDHGLQRLASASRQVSDGVEKLSRGGQRLSPALQRLTRGAQRLSGGLGLLESGAGRLAGGLGEGAAKSRAIPQALRRIDNGLQQQGGGGSLTHAQRTSPGLFHSAYFVLAALDGGNARQRAQLGSLIDIDTGATAARMTIVPRDPHGSQAAQDTIERIEGDAAELAQKTGTEVVIGGVGPGDDAINSYLRNLVPRARIIFSLISLIILVPLLRSLTLPILAALINLLTVSAAFGALSLLFNDSLLGGPGYIEAVMLPAMIIVMFGLAIDYEVFFFARIREEYVRTGSTRAAVERGLERSGPVVTGAAMIMILIFVAFSLTELIATRDFAVAQAVGIFIDAFIVRLIVMPALMIWLGERCWWCPRPLERILPGSGSAENRADALAHGGV